jgi:AcrR family transcriptional regulator
MTKRAAGELEKGARRSEILERAYILFKEKDLDSIKMAEIAAYLGLAKGTLYLYFPSKEALFLALLDERLGAAFANLEAGLSGSPRAATVESVTAGAAAMMAADSVLPRLLAAMHPLLETRLPFEEALAYKRRLAATLTKASEGLARALPPLEASDCLAFLMYFYAQVVGLVSLTDLSPFTRRIAAEPGLEMFRLEFEASLETSARAMLAGIFESASARNKGETE